MTSLKSARLAAALSTLILAPQATAQTPAQAMEEAARAFAEGRFLEAAELAEAVGTSDGLALATKSLAVHAHYLAAEEDREILLERAMALAEQAIAADPSSAMAQQQAAHALGRYALSVGAMTALRRGYAGRIRNHLEAALFINPRDAELHVGLGAWHADIVDRAGRTLARISYGANRGDASEHFERALELAPNSRAVLYEYGLRMRLLEGRDGEQRGIEMLRRAAAIPVVDAHDELVLGEVLAALEEMENGGR